MATSSTSRSSNTPILPAFLNQTKAEIRSKCNDLEWEQRHRLLQGQQRTSPADAPSPWSRLPNDVVTARNRYRDIEPYAQKRIRLKVPEGFNDYINASPIQLGDRKYIATQGPKETNVNHFYRMLAAEVESPAVVVMLTQTHEAGREKCFQYYPLSLAESPLTIPPDDEIPDGFQGEVILESVEDDAKSRSQVRHLLLRVTRGGTGGHEIQIRHVLFAGWPDFLVPEGEDRAALIELIRLSASLNHEPGDAGSDPRAQSNGTASADGKPRIIHCSAGIGRSGTFIALDHLLSLLASGQLNNVSPDRDPVVETVDALRQQRMWMVQGAEQFQFLYDVLREQMLLRMQA